MICPPAIGAGPVVRPFFNRQPAGGPPPDITVTALGSDAETNGGGVSLLDLGSSSLGSTETAFLAVVHNQGVDADNVVYSLNGDPFTTETVLLFNASTYAIHLLSFAMNGTARSGSVLVSFAGSTALPTVAAAFAFKATLMQQVAIVDRIKTGTGNSGTQDSALSAVTTNAHDLIVGAIGTSGGTTDTLGTWSAPLAALGRAGIAGGTADLKVAVGVVAVTAQYRSRVTGATARPYGSICGCYKGI